MSTATSAPASTARAAGWLLLASVLLIACGGGGGGGGGGSSTIPTALKGNLESVTYNPTGGPAGNGSLTAVIDPLDASPITATFDRDTTLDVPGFQAFGYRETTSNRLFVALLATSATGAATAGVVGSGQFTEMVWGANYTGSGFSAPAAGGLRSAAAPSGDTGATSAALSSPRAVDSAMSARPSRAPRRRNRKPMMRLLAVEIAVIDKL